MIALRLIHLIESHADRLSVALAARLHESKMTTGLRSIPKAELRNRMQGLLGHLGEWLLSKSEEDIEARYQEIGSHRAQQQIPLADLCWSIVIIKSHVWQFLREQALVRNASEIYAEMELFSLLDQFFDRALCNLVEGYVSRHRVRGNDSANIEDSKPTTRDCDTAGQPFIGWSV